MGKVFRGITIIRRAQFARRGFHPLVIKAISVKLLGNILKVLLREERFLMPAGQAGRQAGRQKSRRSLLVIITLFASESV